MPGSYCCCLFALGTSLLLGCSTSEPGTKTPTGPRVIRVAIASDLQFVMEELRTRFQKLHPEMRLQITSGSSGTLYSQLTQQAPFDLFLAADVGYAEKLVDQGLTTGPAFHYAQGQLVIWARRESALDLDQQGMQVLVDPAVQKIALANPEHAPYGRAARAAIQAAGFEVQVESKLVLGENVAQAAQFVVTGGADVGLIALSLAQSPGEWPVGSGPGQAVPSVAAGGRDSQMGGRPGCRA